MVDGNAGYRVGDRVQKIDRRSADDRVHPGERGFVTAAPDLGGITVYWDSGMERAVTDERLIRPVPPEEELKLFNGTPCLQLGIPRRNGMYIARRTRGWCPPWRDSPSGRAACGR